jgi:hypothetical protein
LYVVNIDKSLNKIVLLFLTSSQIWLSPLVDDHWSTYFKKLKKNPYKNNKIIFHHLFPFLGKKITKFKKEKKIEFFSPHFYLDLKKVGTHFL